jgi:hypothetical protein
MTDEKFIVKFLNKNYTVMLDNVDIMVVEKDTKQKLKFDFSSHIVSM